MMDSSTGSFCRQPVGTTPSSAAWARASRSPVPGSPGPVPARVGSASATNGDTSTTGGGGGGAAVVVVVGSGRSNADHAGTASAATTPTVGSHVPQLPSRCGSTVEYASSENAAPPS